MARSERGRRIFRAAIALLVAGGSSLFVAGSTHAAPSDTPGGGSADLSTQFGGWTTKAHAAGLDVSYDSPGLIPGTPSPILEGSLPEATSNFLNGPSGYALASVLYPGPFISDFGSVLAVGGFDNNLPPYPIRTQAFYPAGPTVVNQGVGTSQMASATSATGATALAQHGQLQLQLAEVGSLSSQTDTHIEQGATVSRARSEIHGIDLLGGLIHIDSLVTDVVSTSNSSDSATKGQSTLGGVTVLGLPVTVDAAGVHLAKQTSTTPGPSSSTTTTSPLGALTPGLASATAAVNNLFNTVVGGGTTDINKLLGAGGISLTLASPVETKSGAQAERQADGLLLVVHYDGKTEPVMSQLLAAIPESQLPASGIPGFPVNTSPQAMVELLKATHIERIGLGVADVTAAATPAYQASDTGAATGGDTGSPSAAGSSPDAGSPGSTGSNDQLGGFTTPLPALNKPSGSSAIGSKLASDRSTPMAIGGLIFLLLAAALLAWAASTRLAAAVLAAQGGACPDGLDQPSSEGG